jgi:hypothetical protein
MRTLVIAILPLLAFGCAGHDAGSALAVSARSKTAPSHVWPTVKAVVRSFARERGYRVTHEGVSPRAPFQTYAVDRPNEPSRMSLVISPWADEARVELSEIGVQRPSHKQVEIRNALKTRLEAAGLIVVQTDPSIVVTF